MPRKKKIKPPQIEYDLNFSDNTIINNDGFFKKVHKEMVSDFPYVNTWNIKTNLEITSPFAKVVLILDMNYDKDIHIVDYFGSKEISQTFELSCLSKFAQLKGWNIPVPVESLIKTDLVFWKHMWNILLIDSPYFDKRYGDRNYLDMSKDDYDLEDEEDEE